MARGNTIKILRTTRSALDAQAAANGLLVGEPYLITDEGRVAFATAVNAYVVSAAAPVLSTISTTSGTHKDVPSIPAWVSKIELAFAGISLSGTNAPYLQLGTSGGLVNSGYGGAAENTTGTRSTYSSSMLLTGSVAAAAFYSGRVELSRGDGNVWSIFGILKRHDDAPANWTCAGSVSLAGVLTQFRLSIAGGSDTWDAGSVGVRMS